MAEAVEVAFLLVEQVIKLLDELGKPQHSVVDDVRKAKTWLGRMEAYLKQSEAEMDESNEGLQARLKQIQDVAFSIEDALDEYLLHVPNHSHTYKISRLAHRVGHAVPDWRASSKLASRIAGVEKQIDFVRKLDGIHRPEEGSSSTTSQGNGELAPSHPEEDETVGFEEAEEQLSKQFMERNSRRLAISIVGPGGSGKTTLVKNVYKSKQVRGFFHCHAWIDVSRPFVAIKLLLNILRKMDPESNMQEPILQEDTNDLKERLRLALSNKRFVIVLDNIGSKQNLESIASALPNGLSGSKIITTSRNSDVVSSFVSSEYTHDLSLGIPWKNAWYLFCKKAFQNREGYCPEALEEWAQKILKRCEGLPLAISAVGTALANKPQTILEWKNFHDSLGSDVPKIISRSWELSYKDLSSNLKSCFLYFGMFPEDRSISRERLIRLWVAEGFVKPHRTKRIELLA
uniref:putative disease resistance RPP13-like protein 3 n=1 Tax=Fragaria vesca subsp. vesca TaxID=101020 RepID=UPI0005CA85EE|nr:PREDICTED: putative disease resistance RPP13-like protein 3 [Fragaria vesca subsp. vesca]